ncbi:hypothetical protein KR200_010624, partial [Drosophila serrata]
FNMKLGESIIILFPFVILVNGATFLEPNCGISISSSRRSSPRIAGGRVADMFGNPWMAYVLSSNKACGGSLITNRRILKSTKLRNTNEYKEVFLGDFDISSRTDCSARGCMPNALRVPVDQQIPHPRYVRFTRDDIALLRLAGSVRYTDFIRPICLLTNSNPLSTLRHLTVTGWGLTENGRPSNILKTHSLQQFDRSYCARIFNLQVDRSHICAASYNSKSCKGDSGSPVSAPLTLGGMTRIVQFGIMSTIHQYCNSAEVYTNVMHHMGWIREVVRQGGNQTP